MKTLNLIRKLLLVPVLLALVGSSAHGFYDASVGRWLNRDPIGEQGGFNQYRFVRNNPNVRVDPQGLNDGFAFGFNPGPASESAEECGQRIFDELGKKSPFGTKHPSSRWNHCVASCRISRECIGGRFSAWIAGDWYQDPWWKSPSQNSDPGDRAANQVGRDACKKKKSCEESCNDAFNGGSLYPAPPPAPPRPPFPPLGV